MIRKRWFRYTTLALFFFGLGFTYSYHLPKLESYLLVELERQSRERLPIRIWAEDLSFHLVPLGVALENVHILAKPPLDQILAPTTLKQVGARIAAFPLLRGDVRISQLYVRDSEISLFLRRELFAGSKRPTSLKLDFDFLYRLPIDEVSLENMKIQGRLDPQNVVFRLEDLNLLVENRYQSLFVDASAPNIYVKPSGPVAPLRAQVELRTLLEAREAQISAFKLKAGESFIVASGRFNGDLENGKLENGAFDSRAKFQLADFNTWEDVFAERPRLPRLEGAAEIDAGIELRSGKGYLFEADVATSGLQIDKFTVGDIRGKLVSDLKSVSTPKLELRNTAGLIRLSDTRLAFDQKFTLAGSVAVEKINLARFLGNLGLKAEIPVELNLDGKADCQGSLREPFDLGCTAAISTPRLHVHAGAPKRSTIIDVADLRGKGEAHVNLNEVRYKAEIQIGKQSSGTSAGVISYEKGFKIDYAGERLNFGDLKDLVGLHPEGVAKITGKTEGTSDWATIDMRLDGTGMWLDGWPLGEVGSRLTYKAGMLRFPDLAGQLGVSRYNGHVDVDLRRDRIALAAQIPFVELRDVQGLFERKYQLPVQMSGTGTGQLEASGPFDFRRMTYTLKSSFYRGEVAKETFDELSFNVHAVDGLVKSDRVRLSKSSGAAELKGQITPEGVIDTVVVARALRLEQSENVVGLGFDLQGLADITLLIRGQLPSPRVELNGRLSRVVLADSPAEDSLFKLNFQADRMEGSAQFFGSTIISEFTYPYNDQAPFALKVKTKKWDFTNLFSLVSRSARQIDFSTSLSMDVNLGAPAGGFWKSTGQAQIDEFVIRKGGKQMASDKTISISLRDGVINTDNFAVTSGDSYLKFDAVNSTREQLNASLNGKVDLSLLGLFTPFISDLRGYASLSMDVRGSAAKPAISGSAYVDKGYAKFAEFFHPFANVRADLLFNDNQILINSLRADLAGGKVSGDGRVTFTKDSRPIDVKGTFTDVKLNIPDNFRTQGSGTVAIRGERFPYTMEIGYAVTGGEVTAEFGEQSGGDNTVKASAYLPRFLNEEIFHPFAFDVNVNLRNPVNVNNSLVRAPINGQVRARGTPDRLLLNGTLTPAPQGKVFFRDVEFEISSAFVEYTDAPPNDPKIYLTASTRVSENVIDESQRATEHQYDVNMLVQGRGRDPQITLSSQPPLTQREIVSLLALGMTTSNSEENSNFQAANTSTAIGAALLQKAGGRRLKDSFGLDVKVSSSQPTGENASTPKVTLSKQWTPKLGASASSTLTANPTNDVKVEYKMNKSVSVVGTWEGKENGRNKNTPTPNVLGLDLEYKVPFK